MEIQPDKQNLDQTFSTTVYFIDFYQRDYKWTEEPVRRLLDDIFYQFDEAYKKHPDLDASRENINARYPWYYLNTYVTNTVGGRVFVVDGQQRLTTLTLILLKLLSMGRALGSKTTGWLERKIAGYSGTEHEFWMNHARHKQVLEGLMVGQPVDSIEVTSGVTAENMCKNYRLISDELEVRLATLHRLDTFVHYVLFRLVLINLSVDTTHVPMVFEVINDRGVRLKPFEILKGKLLGQIDKAELESGKYPELWESALQEINSFREDEIDGFFRHWFKAKYADSRKVGQRFDGDYHREMFKGDMNERLKLERNPVAVKSFLKGAFRYYAGLHVRLWNAAREENPKYSAVYFNSLNELDSQFMLAISACDVDDPQEDAKIRAVASGLDRMFTLLQLQGAYDSNEFAARLFDISADIRGRPSDEITEAFEKHLLAELSERRNSQATQPFSYAQFKSMSIDRLPTRFTRYFFGRIERLLSEGMRLDMKHSLRELVMLRGVVNGFHIEHILSYNKQNQELFADEHGVFNDEEFDQERNRLGGVLLLKGKDNISSSNEVYAKKLKSYANTLYWNETLREDAYKSKLDFARFAKGNKLSFRAMNQFGPRELEERQRLLFDLTNLAWRPALVEDPAPA